MYYLNKEVENGQWNNDNGKSRRGNDNHNKCTNNSQGSEQERTNGSRNDLINGVDILRETVENSTKGSGIKK